MDNLCRVSYCDLTLGLLFSFMFQKRMRSKEGAKDYRFFPEPDLPPLVVDDSLIKELGEKLPELPDQLKERLCATYDLSSYESSVLVNEAGAAAYFEEVAANPARPSKVVVNWVLNDLFGHLKATNGDVASCPVSAKDLGELLDLIVDGTISGKIAKDVLELMFYDNPDKQSPLAIVEAKNWKQIQDADEIRAICQSVLDDPVSRCMLCFAVIWIWLLRFCVVCDGRNPRRTWTPTSPARRSCSASSSAKS